MFTLVIKLTNHARDVFKSADINEISLHTLPISPVDVPAKIIECVSKHNMPSLTMTPAFEISSLYTILSSAKCIVPSTDPTMVVSQNPSLSSVISGQEN